MADKFLVLAGNWNATGPTPWADTDGGASNAVAPGVGDKVFLTPSSGSGNSVISSAFTVQALNCTGYTGTLTHNSAQTLTINTGSVDSLILSSTMTYSPANQTSVVTFTHTSGTADITSNGKRFAAITINGAGGTTRLLDALRVDSNTSSAFNLTAGTFNGNTFAVTATTFVSSNSNTRVLQLGGGTWTLGGNVVAGTTIWNLTTLTGMTFTKGASNIVVPTNGLAGFRTFVANGLTYNDLTIDSNSSNGMFNITGASSTFANLNVASGNTIVFPVGTTNITTAPTWTGTAALPIMFMSASDGTAATVSIASGTMTITNGGLRDMTAVGGASFVANNAYNFGQNTGWAITPPAAQLTAADIRAAVGLASANLDTQLDALPTNAELATALGTADDAVLAAIPTANANADALLDRAAGVETGLTPRQALRLMAAALFGKATGFDTGSVVYRDTGDTKNRISSAVTAAGRGAPTLDAS